MATASEDTGSNLHDLRRCINDLASLLALPAMWTGQEPQKILKTMVDSLLGMLRLDFIYTRVHASSGDLRLDAIGVPRHRSTASAEDIRRAVEPFLKDETFPSPAVIPNPVGDGEIRVHRLSLGLSEEIGVVFAGSQRDDFPNQTESILLHVAVNQTAIALNAAILISQRRTAEETLGREREQHLEREKTLRAEAESANTLKDEFLATISHELRTPLNAMLGWTRILRTSTVDAQTTDRALEAIERSAKTQAQLIEDLLDVSGIISGKMRLDVQPVDVVPVVQAAIDSVRPAADAKSLRLQSVLDPAAGPVFGDPTRLQQIIWNLLSNAIKFTPKNGRIQVGMQRVDSHVEITVSDSGVGINPKFLPYVFDRFRQADSTMTRSQPGLGLGLAIVRQLVELHGGEVHAYSAGEEKGAVFTVKLPLLAVVVRDVEIIPPDIGQKQAEGAEVPFECPPVLDGLRILVVDDEPDGRELLIAILRRCNTEVRAVGSAAEALTELEKFKPDVMVCDIQMPGEDGFSLIQKIRQQELNKNERIPVAALTAHAGLPHRMRALSAGFDIHLPKPVEPAELVAVIASLARRERRL